MATESDSFAFRSDKDEEQAVDKKDLVAVLPDTDGKSSLIIHVVHHGKDAATPPEVSFSKGVPSAPFPLPQTEPIDQIDVIISTGSGTRSAQQFFDQGVSPVLKALFPVSYPDFNVHITESETSISTLTDEVFFPKANGGVPLKIVLLSGDGGIIDLLNGLLQHEPSPLYRAPQLVLLPLGTANALYHSSSGGKDNTWGLSALASYYRPLPVFTASFSSGARLLVDEARKEEELPKDRHSGHQTLHGAVVCSWGMHASLVGDSDTTEYRKFGIDRFKMAAKEALYPADGSPPHPYKANVSILQNGTWKQLEAKEHMYVLATMVSNLEKTFTISPASKPLDGSLHLVQFGPTSGDEAMRIMGLAYQGGKHVEDPSVLYQAIDGLRVQFDGEEHDARWGRICVDGKIVRVEKDGWVEVKKESRHVLDVALT
jgi:diacylglycerol kinase family enzyme